MLIRNAIIFVLLLFFAVGCSDEYSLISDDLKLTNEFEETTAVYANFSTGDKIHLIRVNRGVAPDNFFNVQNIQDSIQYLPGDLKVYFHKLHKGDTVETYACYDSLVEKEQGEYFNTGEVWMHAFRAPNMFGYPVEELQYLVEVQTPANNVVWALIDPVFPFETERPHPSWSEYGFEGKFFRVEFNSPVNSQIYGAKVQLDFDEIRLADNSRDTVSFQLNISLGTVVAQNPSLAGGGDGLKRIIKISTDEIYKKLSTFIQQNGDLENTIRRRFTGIGIEVLCGNGDLAMSSSSFATSSGFSDDLASYSNVINGLGFVSAHFVYKKQYELNNASIDSVIYRFPEYRFFR